MAPPRPSVTPPTTRVAPPTAQASAPKPAISTREVEKRTGDSDRAPDPGANIARIRRELEEAARAAAAKEAELSTSVSQRDARIRELEAAAAQHDAHIKEIETSSGERIAARDSRIRELQDALSACDERIDKLEQENKALAASQGEPSDDLKMIRGIGPAFERELRRVGVCTFAQIAAWTPEDIDAIGPKIKAKPERIRRESWIESAAELVKRSSESA
jgi:predicted flap endonuclease-1-like 5' DNA nuclease